jgi:hypothetical protein
LLSLDPIDDRGKLGLTDDRGKISDVTNIAPQL